ncbi:uncharacterized protein B0H18DRAFT_1004637 [Fomitopsis serialis]|uniref:uncharacterized protein n=1 Tax=Fomitopsis serialis TaxID=139415 RepID=UPI00200795D5|nr:uncharacterized protein B0H18DRAFT_1004637 [Neoantrodia serialis]KAH9926945.1 hypothetical protein B0H18DRAFT_1004637 [Neoantrodia serialis]
MAAAPGLPTRLTHARPTHDHAACAFSSSPCLRLPIAARFAAFPSIERFPRSD